MRYGELAMKQKNILMLNGGKNEEIMNPEVASDVRVRVLVAMLEEEMKSILRGFKK